MRFKLVSFRAKYTWESFLQLPTKLTLHMATFKRGLAKPMPFAHLHPL